MGKPNKVDGDHPIWEVHDAHRTACLNVKYHTRVLQRLEKRDQWMETTPEHHAMTDFELRGSELRAQAKALVLEYFRSRPEGRPGREGIRQAQVFHGCGLGWGEYSKATSSNQQYWVVALLRELEAERHIEQVAERGPWRLR
jgi:hypothetical protein